MPKNNDKKPLRSRLPKVRISKLFGLGCCSSTDAVATPINPPTEFVDSGVNTIDVTGQARSGTSTPIEHEEQASLDVSQQDAPALVTFSTVVLSTAPSDASQIRLERIEEEEELTEEQRAAQEENDRLLKVHKEHVAKLKADNADPRKREASARINKFLKRRTINSRLQRRLDELSKATEKAAAQKHARRVKIAKRVFMVIAGIALLAIGGWIIKGWLATRAAEAALPVLTPTVPPVIVPPVATPDVITPVVVNNLPNVPVITPALDTVVQNMPSLPDAVAVIPTPPAIPNGLDAEALRRISIYMGMGA